MHSAAAVKPQRDANFEAKITALEQEIAAAAQTYQQRAALLQRQIANANKMLKPGQDQDVERLLAEDTALELMDQTDANTDNQLKPFVTELAAARTKNDALRQQVATAEAKVEENENALTDSARKDLAQKALRSQLILARIKLQRLQAQAAQQQDPVANAAAKRQAEAAKQQRLAKNKRMLNEIAKEMLPGPYVYAFLSIVFIGVFFAGLAGNSGKIDLSFQLTEGLFVSNSIVNSIAIFSGLIFAGWFGYSAAENHGNRSHAANDASLQPAAGERAQAFRSSHAHLSEFGIRPEPADSYLQRANSGLGLPAAAPFPAPLAADYVPPQPVVALPPIASTSARR